YGADREASPAASISSGQCPLYLIVLRARRSVQEREQVFRNKGFGSRLAAPDVRPVISLRYSGVNRPLRRLFVADLTRIAVRCCEHETTGDVQWRKSRSTSKVMLAYWLSTTHL